MASQIKEGPFATCPAGPAACDFRPLGTFMDRSGIVSDVTIAQCSGCGIGITRPTLPDVSVLYADRTSNDFQPDARGPALAIKRIAFRRQAAALLRIAGGAPRRIVDYGCGSGIFTQCLAEVATGATVTGLDFHAEPPPLLGGVDYLPFERAGELDGSADLVIALHVLEHDDDPVALLAKMVAPLKPGGQLLLEVPNVDCVWGKMIGPAWDGWYVPYHRLHFSPTSLRAAVEQAGLSVVHESQASVPTMGRTIANRVGADNSLPFLLAGAALHPVQVALERATRRRSALRLLARKS